MQFEGCVLHAYKCLPIEDYYTIGYGHYGITDGNLTITKEQAEEYLKIDLQNIYDALEDYDRYYEFTDYEYDSLVSFCYNLGCEILAQLTQNDTRNKVEIADAILRYNKANGAIVPGLVIRRNQEYNLFVKGVYPDGTSADISNEVTDKTTIKEIVDMTIAGKFGNGEDRKENWYKMLQKFVNDRY